MDQLLQEGVMQVFYLRDTGQRVPLLAAVGPLQFEVVQYRLESEVRRTVATRNGVMGNAEMAASGNDRCGTESFEDSN